MIAYAARTGTRRNLDALRKAGWRLMVSATGVHRTEGFRYAIDNGAWTAYQQKRPFDSAAFRELCGKHGKGADFIVVPDIVAGGRASIDFSVVWLPYLSQFGTRLLIPVQDGMTPSDVRDHTTHAGIGIFVGGTTEFKETTLPHWAEFARDNNLYCHVGRVNSRRRIRLCHDCGVDSFDGSSASRYAVELPKLNRERVQPSLLRRAR